MKEAPLTASHLDIARSWLVRNGSVLFYGPSAAIDDAVVGDLAQATNGRRVLRYRPGQPVVGLLRALSEPAPLLLVVDAMHRLDRESRSVLRFVAERSDELPIVMVGVEDVAGSSAPKGYRLCPPPLMMIRLSAPESVRSTALTHRRWSGLSIVV